MSEILSQRERWIICRKSDGKILCGLARDYRFKAPEELGGRAMKTYRSQKQALSAFAASWGKVNFEIEAVKIRETMEIID